ncbi:septum formation family protein [Mycolicibacterium sp.]|uniref:septum formation family protein n=1 Tax=Mycolicibacterium sp. TaxID=2320850 RepID=UPI001A2C7CB6|nr:septum formation family protein [Mycolicibacterium sp.]MBJ7339985.1 septum formation family protein [Mycolicibacterium sp.]
MSIAWRGRDDPPTEPLVVCAAQFGEKPPWRSVDRHRGARLHSVSIAIVVVVVTIATVATALELGKMWRTEAQAVTPAVQNGQCVTWPPNAAERIVPVDCAQEHLFEVIELFTANEADRELVQRTYGTECLSAVNRRLGGRFDPDGRFVIGMLWIHPEASPGSAGQVACGLQLPSIGLATESFRGRVTDIDQSKTWPQGTCLALKPDTPTLVTADCTSAHAMEVTGTVDLAGSFGDAPPPASAQDAVLRDACAQATDSYLAPTQLTTTTLAVYYSPIAELSWAAGSRQVACRIGAKTSGGGWAILVGHGRGDLLVDGRPPAAVIASVATIPAAVAATTSAPPPVEAAPAPSPTESAPPAPPPPPPPPTESELPVPSPQPTEPAPPAGCNAVVNPACAGAAPGPA